MIRFDLGAAERGQLKEGAAAQPSNCSSGDNQDNTGSNQLKEGPARQPSNCRSGRRQRHRQRHRRLEGTDLRAAHRGGSRVVGSRLRLPKQSTCGQHIIGRQLPSLLQVVLQQGLPIVVPARVGATRLDGQL